MTTPNPIFIGVDPGKSGSIAFLPLGSDPWTVKTSETTKDLADALRDAGPVSFGLLEFVSSSPQMGVKSAFSFGQSFGALESLLICCGVPFERITPAKWQRVMGCRTGGDKNVSKKRAQELFPSIKVTHANADALLLARLAMLQSTNNLP